MIVNDIWIGSVNVEWRIANNGFYNRVSTDSEIRETLNTQFDKTGKLISGNFQLTQEISTF